jgi:adenosylmethionine-8-amino-7-oxononanoate aminotransferase
VFRDERIVDRVRAHAPVIEDAFARIAALPGVERVRTIGMIGAADLRVEPGRRAGYLEDAGWRVYAEARKRGAYLRPLGNTVYVCPPLTIERAELESLLAMP